jgi:hypothetical protein
MAWSADCCNGEPIGERETCGWVGVTCEGGGRAAQRRFVFFRLFFSFDPLRNMYSRDLIKFFLLFNISPPA